MKKVWRILISLMLAVSMNGSSNALALAEETAAPTEVAAMLQSLSG